MKSGALEMVNCLIEHGANVNNEDGFKGTPLHYAVETGSLEIVTYLIEHGADVNNEGGFKVLLFTQLLYIVRWKLLNT